MQKTIYLLFISLGFISGIEAQDPYYFLTIENETYQPLEDAISLTLGSPWDDPDYNMPIGFDFDFFGETITDLTIDEAFLGGIVSTNSEADTSDLFIVYGSDLIDRGFGTPTGQSEVSFKIEGDPGSQIFKLEWNNAGFYNEIVDFNSNESFVNIQLWLFEASQAIEIHFGPSMINPDYDPHDGLPGPLVGLVEDFSFLTGDIGVFHGVFGESDSPILQTVAGDGLDTLVSFLQGHPSDGVVYRFNSPVSSVSEVDRRLEVKIFPTAVIDEVHILAADKNLHEMEVQVINTIGRVVDRSVFSGSTGQITLANHPSGIYFIQVKNGGRITTKKVYKQ